MCSVWWVEWQELPTQIKVFNYLPIFLMVIHLNNYVKYYLIIYISMKKNNISNNFLKKVAKNNLKK